MTPNPALALANGPENPAYATPVSRLEQVKARAKQQRERLMANLHHDIDVPSWEGNLVARYRVLGQDVRDELKAANITDETKGAVALIAKACTGLYLRDEDGGLIPVQSGDGPVARYDRTLVDALGLDGVTTDYDIVRVAFGGDNPSAIEAHAMELGAWMVDPRTPASAGKIQTD